MVAILIILVAFGAGYGGRKLVEGDDAEDVPGISAQEGGEVPLGISRPELEERLGEPPTAVERPPAGAADECLYYGVTDEADSVWEFCFRDDELVTSGEVGAGSR